MSGYSDYSAAGSFAVADYQGRGTFKGPRKNRCCTDVYCLVVFVGFIVGWLIVANYAYWNGDIARLYSPSDTSGQMCGVDGPVKDKPYLLFFDISQCVTMSVLLYGCPTKQICVSKCPTDLWFADSLFDKTPKNFETEKQKLICVSDDVVGAIHTLEDLRNAILQEKCAPYYLPSVPVGNICLPSFVRSVNGSFCLVNPADNIPGRMCLPDVTRKDVNAMPIDAVVMEDGYNSIRVYFHSFYQTAQMIHQDLILCWRTIMLLMLASVISCLVFITILSFVARIMVWFIFFVVVILLAYSTFAAYVKYQTFENSTISSRDADLSQDSPQAVYSGEGRDDDSQKMWPSSLKTFWPLDTFKEMTKNKEFWSTLTIVCAVLFVAFLLLVLFLRKRINLAIMIIREGSKAINDMKSTLLFPLIPLLLKFAVIAWFVFVFSYLKTLGNSVYTIQGMHNDTDCVCHTMKYQDDMWCLPQKFNQYCHSSRGGMNSTCRSADCVFQEPRSSKFTLYLQAYNFFGLLWGIYFVSGLGRLILSYCFACWYWCFNKDDVPYFILTKSVYVAVRYHLGTVAVGSFLISTLSFVRSLVEYLHRNLKKYDNLVAQCLFWSLRGCFWLLQKFLAFISENAYTMCAIYGDGFWKSAQSAVGLLVRNIVRVVVLDKVVDFLILMGKVGLTYMMIMASYYTFKAAPLNYSWIPTAIVGLLTWIIASTFFSVYVVAVDTLFLCFLKDGEINDGSQEKPYYMSRDLKYVLHKKLDYRRKKVEPR